VSITWQYTRISSNALYLSHTARRSLYSYFWQCRSLSYELSSIPGKDDEARSGWPYENKRILELQKRKH